MNPELLQMKGMLAENKKRFRTLDTEASGTILIIRSQLNPYEEITSLDTDKVLVLSHRLNKIVQEMKELKEKIKKLEQELEQQKTIF